MGRNVVRLELPAGSHIHPVVHIEHTVPYKEQPEDLQEERIEVVPVEGTDGVEYEVEAILSHRRRVVLINF